MKPAAICLCILPAVLAFIYTWRYSCTAVMSDEWAFIPLLQKFYLHQLSPMELLTFQHGEHRLALPMVAYLLLCRITNYSSLALNLAGIATLAVTTFLLVAYAFDQLRGSSIESGNSTTLIWSMVPITWIMFSLRQWENFVSGYSLSILLVAMLVTTTIISLDGVNKLSWRFLVAILSALAATFTYGNGLFLWPIGFVQLIANCLSSAARANSFAVIRTWFAVGGLVVLFYFYHYSWTAKVGHNSGFMGSGLAKIAEFSLAAFANPLAVDETTAIGIGLIYLALIIFVSVQVFREYKTVSPRAVAPLMLILFATASTLVVIGCRIGEGLPLSSRYASMLNLGLVGVYLLLLYRVQDYRVDDTQRAMRNERSTYLGLGAFLTLVAAGLIPATRDAILNGEWTKETRMKAATVMETVGLQSEEIIRTLVPGPLTSDNIKEEVNFLETSRLNCFGKFSETTALSRIPRSSNTPQVSIEKINDSPINDSNKAETAVISGQTLTITGWAIDPKSSIPFAELYLTVDDRQILPVTYPLSSPDLATQMNDSKLRRCRFLARISTRELVPGVHCIAFEAVDKSRSNLEKTPILARIKIAPPLTPP